MLLTISTTHEPATDLGFLLHKHPGRVQSFPQSVGTAHVFYPEAEQNRCTAALLLEVDPIGLVRGRRGPSGDGFALGQYVNDRPYAASSMLAMALKDVFRTALLGRCNAKPELAAAAIPLELHMPTLPCRGSLGSESPCEICIVGPHRDCRNCRGPRGEQKKSAISAGIVLRIW